jgi:SAM-dependent methyltransferase
MLSQFEEDMSESTQSFTQIYRDHTWRGESRSGPGSDCAATAAYRRMLERFLATHPIRNVLDIGCGDWESSRLVNWKDVKYFGVDVVPDLVARNSDEFGSPTVRFAVLDFMVEELPPADLLICKDVLQHLPNTYVHMFLNKISVYPYALLTNDIATYKQPTWTRFWRHRRIGPPKNSEITLGGKRNLCLREPPFSIRAERQLQYTVRHTTYKWVKETLLVRN